MMLSDNTLNSTLELLYLPIKEDSDQKLVFFTRMDDKDLPTHFKEQSFVLNFANREGREREFIKSLIVKESD